MISPDNERIQYLAKTNFIRNPSTDELLRCNDFEIDLTSYICYCVGIIEEKRYVHCIQILSKTPSPGITSYQIKWWNTACYCLNDNNDEVQYEATSFWVHSGVALRKHFFLFQDRMSLIRSTFIYDSNTEQYYRICSLTPYLYIPIISPNGMPIYTSPKKTYCYHKVIKKGECEVRNKQRYNTKKYLKKFVKQFNHFSFLEEEYPRLFEEIIKITDSDK